MRRSTVQRDLAAPTRRAKDMSHRGEGKAVLVISQFSHNLSVSLSNHYSAKNLKLTQVEHACSTHCITHPTNFHSERRPDLLCYGHCEQMERNKESRILASSFCQLFSRQKPPFTICRETSGKCKRTTSGLKGARQSQAGN